MTQRIDALIDAELARNWSGDGRFAPIQAPLKGGLFKLAHPTRSIAGNWRGYWRELARMVVSP